MSARHTVGRFLSAPEEWSRHRLQILAAVAFTVAMAVTVGVAWSVVDLLRGSSDASPVESPESSARDDTVGGEADPLAQAQPGPVVARPPSGTITLPQPTRIGTAQVGTGFPQSAGGAIAQLIAIDQRAIGSASVVTAQDVISAWAAPGGPTPDSWSGVTAVQTLLDAAGLPANGTGALTIQLQPEMGFIRNAAASPPVDQATVCVDFVLTATVAQTTPTQIAVADCQHMIWSVNRWVIGAGEEPAPAVSAWPGTQASYDAGFQWLDVQP